MKRFLLLVGFLIPLSVAAQFHITGRVINIADKKPVDNVNVFLSNASAGTKTNANGSFDISNVLSGHYELVVSIVGFATYRQNILVNNNIALPDIGIEIQNKILKEVTIGPDPNRERNYQIFKKEFLGTSANADHCKILNPDMVDITDNIQKRQLIASSDDFIIVENKALGYSIKYLLNNFVKDYSVFNLSSLYYEGSSLFEEMKGSPADEKKWQKKRLETYLGSDMHFLKSIVADRVTEEGFVVRRLIRKPNPEFPKKSNNRYIETLVSQPLKTSDYVKLTDQKGEYALVFTDCLYINYFSKGSHKPATSIITFTEPHIYFDNNGIIVNPQSAVFEDAWGTRRVADMLPVDYQPQIN
ncbi:MAG: carboxypeptidase-like regulatory domain-containing protein [Mucilaginibacter sp.]